jgi:hypothetical protein
MAKETYRSNLLMAKETYRSTGSACNAVVVEEEGRRRRRRIYSYSMIL